MTSITSTHTNFSAKAMPNKKRMAPIKKRRMNKLAWHIQALIIASHSSLLMALPQNAEVASGDISISSDQNHMRIQQTTERGIINYSSFDVAAGEKVSFEQPNKNSVTLNRIQGSNRSEIFGSIESNGSVVLVNPNGVMFSQSATIDVGGLIASTIDVDNQSFNSDTLVFEGNSAASIKNHGHIFAKQGGYIALIGHDIENTGTLEAKGGNVGLLSGRKVVVGFEDETVAFDVSEFVDRGRIKNSGIVSGDLGVTLNVQSVDDIERSVINNEGIVRATGFAMKGGKVVITASAGSVANNGEINADSSLNSGDVDIDTERFFNAGKISANAIGDGDGGTIDIYTDDVLFLTPDSVTEANGAGHGDGGKVIHYSDNATWYAPGANANARAGKLSGDGGFIEVSGRQYIAFEGNIDTTAANGDSGVVYIDPTDIEIKIEASSIVPPGTIGNDITIDPTPGTPSYVPVASIEAILKSNNHVIIDTASTESGEPGVLTVVDSIDLTGVTSQTLTLKSNGNMAINANICASDGAGGCDASKVFDTGLLFETHAGGGGSIAVADNIILDSGTANITFDSDNNISLGDNSTLRSASGTLNFLSGSLSGTGSTNLSFGNEIILPDSGINLPNTINLTASDVRDQSGRELSINAQRINLVADNPVGDISIGGQIYGIDVTINNNRNFRLNANQSKLNLTENIDIHDINLAGGDFSATIGGGRRTLLTLNNYTNVNNLSLNNPSGFGVLTINKAINLVNSNVTVRADVIRGAGGSATVPITAKNLSFTTRSWGTNTTLQTNVDTLDLDFNANRVNNLLKIEETDALIINSITQSGANNLEIEADGKITLNDIELSNVSTGAADTSTRIFKVTSKSDSIIIDGNIADDTSIIDLGTNITLKASAGSISFTDKSSIVSGSGVIDLNSKNISIGGQLSTASNSASAIKLTTTESISTSNTGLLQAALGGAIVEAGTTIDIKTELASLAINSTSSDDVTIGETDALTITSLTVPNNNLIIKLESGNLTLPDDTLAVTGNLELSADDIVNASGSDLDFSANQLNLKFKNITGDKLINTSVNSLLLEYEHSTPIDNITINEADQLTLGSLTQRGNSNLNINTQGDVSFASNAQLNLDGGRLNIDTGAGKFTLNSSAKIESTDGPMTITASTIELDGDISSTLSDPTTAAITLNSSTNIDTNAPTSLIEATGSRIELNAASGIKVNTSANNLIAKNSDSGEVVINETDDLTITELVADNATINLASGELVIPSSGISVGEQLTLSADHIANTDASELNISANELIFTANKASSAINLKSSVASLDAKVIGQDFKVSNTTTLDIFDINGDNSALTVENGNAFIASTSGKDISLNDNVSIIDQTRDGRRTGQLSIIAEDANVFIGNRSATSIDINSEIDMDSGSGIDSKYSDNAVFQIQQNAATQSRELVLGNIDSNNVDVTIRGGDFVADFYDNTVTSFENAITVNAGVSFTLLADGSNPNGGTIHNSGVEYPQDAFTVAEGRNVYLAKGEIEPPPTPPPVPEVPSSIEDVISDISPSSETTESTQITESTKQPVNSIASVFGYKEQHCDNLNERSTQQQCRLDQVYRRFLGSFLISGQLPDSSFIQR